MEGTFLRGEGGRDGECVRKMKENEREREREREREILRGKVFQVKLN